MASILKVDTIQDQSGNNIINENADTITIGASGDTVNVVGTLQNNGAALISGITEADQWRPSTTTIGNGTTVTSWERVDTGGFNYIGSGMTHSSGVFTFPSTGIYLIKMIGSIINSSSSDYLGIEMRTTQDNSTYVRTNVSYESSYTTNGYAGAILEFIFDVTNTSTHKVKFNLANSQSGTPTLLGSTDKNESSASFIRLGDT